MSDISELIEIIQELRHQLNSLIATRDNLQDPEIIQLSSTLDNVLSEYEGMLRRKNKD